MYPSSLRITPLPAPWDTDCPKYVELDIDSVFISTTLGLHFSAISETSVILTLPLDELPVDCRMVTEVLLEPILLPR